MSLGWLAAPFVAIGVFCAVNFILKDRKLLVRASACVFIISLVSTQLLMAALGNKPFQFKSPAWVTTLHFSCAWTCTVIYWAWKGDLHKCSPTSLGSVWRYSAFILPIACSLPLSVVLNNQAMLIIGPGLNGTVGALTPITTALLSVSLGRRFPSRAWLGVLVACLGAVVITEVKISGVQKTKEAVVGLTLAFLAVVFRSLKVVLQDNLMTPVAFVGESRPLIDAPSLEPMHVWALQGPPCVIVSAVYAACVENTDAWFQLTPNILGMIAGTCVSATILNLLGMSTIKDLGGTSMQIIGKLNIIVLVTFSTTFLGESFPFGVIGGVCLVLVGVAIFEEAQRSINVPVKKLALDDTQSGAAESC